MRPWSTSVMTQGIRLRQRALSSTAPAKPAPRVQKPPSMATSNIEMLAALTAIANMKKDDKP